MQMDAHTILIVKYVFATAAVVGVILAPAWMAAKNDKGKVDIMRVRVASWVFGWTGIGWMLALFWAIKK